MAWLGQQVEYDEGIGILSDARCLQVVWQVVSALNGKMKGDIGDERQICR